VPQLALHRLARTAIARHPRSQFAFTNFGFIHRCFKFLNTLKKGLMVSENSSLIQTFVNSIICLTTQL
jgi:hypothetical protein